MRIEGALKPVDWEVALTAVAEGLQKVRASHGASSLGFLASPSSTVEELYLLAQIARGLGSNNIDHRLRQLDFRGQQSEGAFPSLGLPIKDVDLLEGVLVIGSNLRPEMPMLAHRIRKAAVKHGAKVAFLNPRRFEYLFPVAAYGLAQDLPGELAAVVRAAAAAAARPVPDGVRAAHINDGHQALAAALSSGTRRAVILGALAQRHPDYSEIRALAAALAALSGASVGVIAEGANAAGAYLAGAVPHREPGGAPSSAGGLPARAMLESRLKAYLLCGGIDPAVDLAGPSEALAGADFVVAATTHLPERLRDVAHVVLPIGSFAESSGTFVNAEGRWQSWPGAVSAVGESRPAWKVLRVLANLLNIRGIDYLSSEEVRDALLKLCGDRITAPTDAASAVAAFGTAAASDAGASGSGASGSGEWIDIPPYQVDVLVRGSESLAKTRDGHMSRAVL
jgi:NADH-quinone oxidoreductase subunit G